MAFKMTPGIKGNPSMNRIKNLGACGGPGQPPCEPRFQKEVEEEKQMRAIDRSSSSIGKSIKPKIKQVPVEPPKPPIRPNPPRLKINLPKDYGFMDREQEAMFFDKFETAIENGAFRTQEELDMAIMKHLKGGAPHDPKEPGGPVIDEPIVRPPGKFEPIPIKGGGEFEAVPVKGADAVKGK